ncbi:MAG: hypothetical protein OXJ52_02615 [Oligoflexia bacterium]|nr:hypothetical protein [Oligoflexia bacterium]
MNEKLWNKIDKHNCPYYINPDDICAYAREYILGKGYEGGQTNSDILNFKKPPNKKGRRYRQEAILKFKQDIEKLFQPIEKKKKL